MTRPETISNTYLHARAAGAVVAFRRHGVRAGVQQYLESRAAGPGEVGCGAEDRVRARRSRPAFTYWRAAVGSCSLSTGR